MRCILTRKDLCNAQFISIMARLALGEQGLDFRHQRRRQPFIRIEIEQPGMPALLLGKALLWPIAGPIIVNDARTGRLGQGDGVIGRAESTTTISSLSAASGASVRGKRSASLRAMMKIESGSVTVNSCRWLAFVSMAGARRQLASLGLVMI